MRDRVQTVTSFFKGKYNNIRKEDAWDGLVYSSLLVVSMYGALSSPGPSYAASLLSIGSLLGLNAALVRHHKLCEEYLVLQWGIEFAKACQKNKGKNLDTVVNRSLNKSRLNELQVYSDLIYGWWIFKSFLPMCFKFQHPNTKRSYKLATGLMSSAAILSFLFVVYDQYGSSNPQQNYLLGDVTLALTSIPVLLIFWDAGREWDNDNKIELVRYKEEINSMMQSMVENDDKLANIYRQMLVVVESLDSPHSDRLRWILTEPLQGQWKVLKGRQELLGMSQGSSKHGNSRRVSLDNKPQGLPLD